MNLRSSVWIACILLCAAQIPAQNSNENSKQQAKDFVDRAKSEDADRARQVQDYCSAAQMEPKNKKYVDTCNSFRAGLLNDDTAWLASAIQAYKSHDLDKAESLAKLVTNYDDKLSGQARFLLDRIKNEKLLGEVKSAWEKGDFNAVTSLAQNMTNPDLRASANVFVSDVNLYNGYIDQAKKLERDNPQEAIRQLTMAQSLNPNGPGNPAAMIAELQKPGPSKSSSPAVANNAKPSTDSTGDISKKVSKLISDAHDAEKQGKLPDALNDYGMVLKLQPGNQEAQSNTDRIEQALKNDPAAARNELASAIRYFYNSQLDEAQTALTAYLKSPDTAKNPGAAYFYLGATLIEQSLLDAPRSKWQGASSDAQSAFLQARKANYSPVRDYVSPALLKVWDATGQ